MATSGAKTMPTGHTAGIFADMRLDGPEIGTLVAVIDRAKNLPNRRTMGKQDPYCAMRLGKEAKKTGTDRRGGQTPRWDQELRFTVHDSGDYYKLKCSVFNDDKKTDLIGEAWIDLTSVVVPGGGQNDMWHQLQSKGKYAGDIRMELSYYDTRSKSEGTSDKAQDRRSDHNRLNSHNSDVVGGPRKLGPREVKRRPLPPDQVPITGERPSLREPAHSAPLPHVRPEETDLHSQHAYGEQPIQASYDNPSTNVQNSHLAHTLPFNSAHHGYPSQYEYEQPQADMYQDLEYQTPSYHDGYGPPDGDADFESQCRAARSSFPTTPVQFPGQGSFEGDHRIHSEPYDRSRNRSSPSAVPSVYGSSPPSFNGEPYTLGSSGPQYSPSFPRHSTSPTKTDVFRDSPLRQSISQRDVNSEALYHSGDMGNEGPPPPPPAHRSTLPVATSSSFMHPNVDQVQMPQPLNLGGSNRRISAFDRSPLQSIERNYNPDPYSSGRADLSGVASPQSYLPYSKPSYSEVDLRSSSSLHEQSPNGLENIPPSLRSGNMQASRASAELSMQNEDHLYRQPLAHTHPTERREMNRFVENGLARYQAPRVDDEWPSTPGLPAATNPARAMSSDSRSVPKRKAVSPQPEQAERHPSPAAIPFGPDSYDVFNPSSPGTSPIPAPSSRYETPEQAKEVARQQEVEKLRDQGPIIGNDGRVIDPSDHLPTDTWAPEPGRKNRKPEVVVRYKFKENASPAVSGRGSSPGLARPHSVGGPFYGSPGRGEELPAVSAQQQNARARLQKRAPGRPLPLQAYPQTHSSPAVPTNNHPAGVYYTPSPRSSFSNQAVSPEYAVDEMRQHRTSIGSSPTYGYGRAPPIPDKVPISPSGWRPRYGGDESTDALSAELSTIDINAGAGGRGGQMTRGYWP